MLPSRSIRALAEGLRNGAYSAQELLAESLAAIERAAELNAFITLDADRAREAARAADRAIADGEAGPLAGIPIAHKDIFCTAGVRTTCGSRMLSGFVPPYDSTVTARLRDAGAVAVGKTNMDEFAMGSSGEYSHFGPIRNPWNADRVPGGSSGGSAAAVAASLVAAATGTDTGGSVRQPAAFCGVTGLKPSYGRVSRFGMIAFASSLDQAGVLGESAEDCALLLGAIAGPDPRDATSARKPVPDYLAQLGRDLSGLTVGLPRRWWGDHVEGTVAAQAREACRVLESLGARLSEIELGGCEEAVACYYVIAPAEASSNLSRFDGVRYGHRCEDPADLAELYERSRSEGFGTEVQRRILTGTFALSSGYYEAYYGSAQKVRRVIANDFSHAFEGVDLIAAPTAPEVAFPIGKKSDDPIAMYRSDLNTVGASLAGLPAVSLPAGRVDGMPVGLQLIAPAFEEGRLLAAAHQLQQASGWHRERPAHD